MRIHCRFCGLPHELDITPHELVMFSLTKDATRSFPRVLRDKRELIITGMCDQCFKETFDPEFKDKPHPQRVWTEAEYKELAWKAFTKNYKSTPIKTVTEHFTPIFEYWYNNNKV